MKLVKFKDDILDGKYGKHYPFSIHQKFVMLGEIANMPGHCVISDYRTGHIYSGYHTDDFKEISEDEV